MTEDVTQGESQSTATPSVENKEQGNDGQAVEKQDNQSTDIVENYKRAMQKEREKRKKLQEQLNQVQTRPQSQEDDHYVDEDKELDRLKTENWITRKLVEDPTFRDRSPSVLALMEENPGMTIEQADNAILADFTRKMLSNAQQVKESNPVPNQITTSAVSEAQSTQPVSSLDDVLTGKGTTGVPEMDNAFKKLAGGSGRC